MTAIKNIYQLEKVVDDYMKRHNLQLKHSFRNIDYNYYNVTTTDYKLLEARIIKMANGKTRTMFKIDGKITKLQA